MSSNNNAAVIVPPPSSTATLTNDIHAARPPVPVPNDWAWAWWLGGTLLAVAAITAALVWWRKKLVAPKPAVVIPPHVRAKQKLAAALQLISDPKAFCTAVSDTLRVYLEERFQFHAPDRTTEEFLIELQTTHHLTPDQKISLADFLQNCALVKSARFDRKEQSPRSRNEAALRRVDKPQCEPLPPSPPPPLPPGGRSNPPPLPPRPTV